MTTLEQLFADAPQESTPTLEGTSEMDAPNTAGQVAGETISKSERIRRFLSEHPEARNRDVVGALASFGVSAADVGNVKSQMKKKASGQRRQRRKANEAAKAVASTPKVEAQTPEKNEALKDVNSGLGIDIIEAGVDFIRRAGGINEAQYVLNLIRQIRSM